MAKQFTLGKNERLKSRKSIEQLFSEGKKIVVTPYRIVYVVVRSEEPGVLFGVGVPAKSFKKAVDRNRIKRLTREAWRLQKITLQEKLKVNRSSLNVFFIYTGKELPVYNEIYKKMGAAIKKLERSIDL